MRLVLLLCALCMLSVGCASSVEQHSSTPVTLAASHRAAPVEVDSGQEMLMLMDEHCDSYRARYQRPMVVNGVSFYCF